MPANVQFALYAVLLGGFFVAALWRPPAAIAAVLCLYGLKQWGQTSNGWLAAHSSFTNFAIGAVVLVALASRVARSKCILCNIRGAGWVVIALYGYCLLSLIWTPRPDLALAMWASAAPYVITGILLAPLVIGDADDLYQACWILLILGGTLVVALLAFAKWGERGLLISGFSPTSDMETNPLAIANLGGAVATAAMFLRTRLLPAASWLVRLGLVAAALALVVKTGSRGQLVTVIATLVLMLPVAFPISRIRGLIPIFMAVAVVGMAAQYSAQTLIKRDDDRWSQRDTVAAASERWRMGSLLLSHWADSPATVVFGLGNSAAYDPEIIGIYPHDVPVEVLGEEGLVGLAIYLSLNGLALRGFLRSWRVTRDNPQQRPLLAVAAANFVFAWVTTFKEGNMVPAVEYFMAAILLARMPELLAARTAPTAATPATIAVAPPRPLFANIMR
ncbi:MAG TPA: O-antigen ligase family protein [Steroidobacteraceae bacterium]|nr:O-antigen ligase family protein [Steroidobacteraceae bacterium]